MFSLASLETSAPFPTIAGPPGFVAIQGKVYHRVRPSHQNSGIRWILYDGFLASSPPFSAIAATIPPDWIQAIQSALLQLNPIVRCIRTFSTMSVTESDTRIVLDGPNPTNEIAAIMNFDNTIQSEVRSHCLITIRQNDEGIHPVAITSRLWEPLAYPLFFPSGTLGWGINGSVRDLRHSGQHDHGPDADSATTQIWHYRARLLREPRFQIFGRLTN